jgi:hypothetical protein
VARIRPAPNAGREAYRQASQQSFRNSIIILAAAVMLGAVALASNPASAHHMGGFRMGGYHHMAYRQHFFTPGIDSFSGIRSSSGAILL